MWLSDNPCSFERNYRVFVIKTLPQLTKLDSTEVTVQERVFAMKHNFENQMNSASPVELPDLIHQEERNRPAVANVRDFLNSDAPKIESRHNSDHINAFSGKLSSAVQVGGKQITKPSLSAIPGSRANRIIHIPANK